ncbi:MAG: hypothetical protein R3D78_14145 [Paracoccaceae bacterium]|jgi:hypothetical protein
MRKSVFALSLVSIFAAGAALASPVSQGAAQLAAQAGVSAQDYTAGQLAGLWAGLRDNDSAAAPYTAPAASVMSSKNGAAIPAGRAQLAAQLGVDAGAYTSAQLYGMVAQLDRN